MECAWAQKLLKLPSPEFSQVQSQHLRSITHPFHDLHPPRIQLCSILRWCYLHVKSFLCDVYVPLSQVNFYM